MATSMRLVPVQPGSDSRSQAGPKGAALFAEQVLERLIKLKPELVNARTPAL